MAQLDQVLWIGGAQWAGKSTVSIILAARYPVVRYAYDYHDARSHSARARTDPLRYPTFSAFLDALDSDPDSVWSDPSPEQMAQQMVVIFQERFEMVLQDLAALPEESSVLAEGWGLRPDLIAPHIKSPNRTVFLVPSDAFRQRQLAALERAKAPGTLGLRDPERAQRNRVARDGLLAADVVARATQLRLPIIEVDGQEDVQAVTARVEEGFRPYLPAWLY